MPIYLANPSIPVSEKEFREIDFEVMRYAFRIHNEMGRLFDESKYQIEMEALVGREFEVHRESGIDVHHQSFAKRYRIDFLVANSVIYEFKRAPCIVAAHEGQLLQYMLLSEAVRGKVVNFGESTVKGNLVSTSLCHRQRRELQFDLASWQEGGRSKQFASVLIDLLQDIGGFLSLSLYYEAMTHLLGGEEEVIRSVSMRSYTSQQIRQSAHLLDEATAYKLDCSKRRR